MAERALPVAIGVLSDRRGATLILMRAAGTPEGDADDADGTVPAVGEAVSYLEAVAERLRNEGLSSVVTTSVWSSASSHAIIEAARTRRATVIV